MLNHRVQVVFDVPAFDDSLSTAVIEGYFGEQACNVKTQFFTLAELRVKEDVAEFSDRPLCQLWVTVVNIRQVAECTSHLDQDHGFPIRAAVELEQFTDRQGQQSHHLVIDGLLLHLSITLRETLNCADSVVEEVENFLIVPDLLVRHSLAQQIAQEWVAMLDETLRDHVAKLGDQTLDHEHPVEFTLLGVDQQSSHGLVQITKHLLEVGRCLDQRVLCDNHIENFEEAVDVAIRDL